MINPQSARFLSLRFKRVRYFVWRWFTPSGRMRRMYRVTYRHCIKSAEWHKRVRDCPHTFTTSNPEATAVLDCDPQVCNLCGIGILGKPISRRQERP